LARLSLVVLTARQKRETIAIPREEMQVATRALLQRDGGGRRRFVRPRSPSWRGRVPAVTLFSLAALLGLVPTAAAGTLDQSQPVINTNAAVFVSDEIPEAQTFTSGLSGRLDQVDIAIGRTAGFVTAPLVVQIRAVSGGVPSGPALAGASIPAANVPVAFFPSAFYSVPFASPAPVTAGVQYAVVVSSLSCGLGNCYEWAPGPVGNPYPAGTGLNSQDFGATWTPLNAFGSTDFPFKTYVLQAPTSKEQCKKGGWRKFTNPSFKNQGQCVKFVNHQRGKGKKANADTGDGDRGNKKGGKKK